MTGTEATTYRIEFFHVNCGWTLKSESQQGLTRSEAVRWLREWEEHETHYAACGCRRTRHRMRAEN